MDLKSLVPWRSDSKSNVAGPRGDSLDPFVAFRHEVDRMFDGFFDGFGRTGRALTAVWPAPAPTIDLVENEKDIVISAELPGLDEKDFEVTVAGDVLTLKGEKKLQHEERNGDSYYAERRYGSFARSVHLPFEVKDEAIEANYDKGVLTVRLPKPVDLQRSVRRIEVKRGA
jgi:HSP20 family protein